MFPFVSTLHLFILFKKYFLVVLPVPCGGRGERKYGRLSQVGYWYLTLPIVLSVTVWEDDRVLALHWAVFESGQRGLFLSLVSPNTPESTPSREIESWAVGQAGVRLSSGTPNVYLFQEPSQETSPRLEKRKFLFSVLFIL